MTKLIMLFNDEIDELYSHLPGESEPQPVRLRLSLRDGTFWCSNDRQHGAETIEERHGIVLSQPMPAATAAAAGELLQRCAKFAQLVLDDSEIRWDGNNHIGVLGQDASKAWDLIVEQCSPEMWSQRDLVEGMALSEWFNDPEDVLVETLGITDRSTDEDLAELASEQVREASKASEAGYAVLDWDETLAFLTRLRDDMREGVRQRLMEVADLMVSLGNERADLILQIRGWGTEEDTLRAIAEMAGMTHTSVRRVVNAAKPVPAELADLAWLVGAADLTEEQRDYVRMNMVRRTVHVQQFEGGVWTSKWERNDYTSLGEPEDAAGDVLATSQGAVDVSEPGWRVAVWKGHHANTSLEPVYVLGYEAYQRRADTDDDE